MSKICGVRLLLIIFFELLLKYNFEYMIIFMLWYYFINWEKLSFSLLSWSYCTPIINKKNNILRDKSEKLFFYQVEAVFSQYTNADWCMERGTWLIDELIHICTILNEKLNALWVTSTELTESSPWELFFLKQSALKSAGAWYLGEEYAVVLLCRLHQHALFLYIKHFTELFRWFVHLVLTDWAGSA